MVRRFRPSRHLRLRLGLLALVALLFQQTALAAHVCPLCMARPVAAMAASMATMPGSLRAQWLCTQHCTQGTPAPHDAHVATPPALALPPQPPVLATLSPPARWFEAGGTREPHAASPPAPSCVLLI